MTSSQKERNFTGCRQRMLSIVPVSLKRLIFPFLFSFGWCLSFSQTCMITQGASVGSGLISAAIEQGQSFTACGTGNITTISINLANVPIAGDATLKIDIGSNLTTVPQYTQTVNFPLGTTGDFPITLTTPFPVVNGTQYTFSFVGIGATNVSWNFQAPDVLAGGNAFQTGFVFLTVDFRFSLNIVAPPIPTMSQWGLLIFGLLIMNLGVFFVQRRELIG